MKTNGQSRWYTNTYKYWMAQAAVVYTVFILDLYIAHHEHSWHILKYQLRCPPAIHVIDIGLQWFMVFFLRACDASPDTWFLNIFLTFFI